MHVALSAPYLPWAKTSLARNIAEMVRMTGINFFILHQFYCYSYCCLRNHMSKRLNPIEKFT